MADEVGVEENIADEVADAEVESAVLGGVDGEGGELDGQLEDTGGGDGESVEEEEDGAARPGHARDGDADGDAADDSNEGSTRGGSADGGDPDGLPDGGAALRTESQLSWESQLSGESLGSTPESPRGSPLSVQPQP